jgi:hypothetical protein
MPATRIGTLAMTWKRPHLPHVVVRLFSTYEQACTVVDRCSRSEELDGLFHASIEAIASGSPLSVDGSAFSMANWVHEPVRQFRLTVRFSNPEAASRFQRLL